MCWVPPRAFPLDMMIPYDEEELGQIAQQCIDRHQEQHGRAVSDRDTPKEWAIVNTIAEEYLAMICGLPYQQSHYKGKGQLPSFETKAVVTLHATLDGAVKARLAPLNKALRQVDSIIKLQRWIGQAEAREIDSRQQNHNLKKSSKALRVCAHKIPEFENLFNFEAHISDNPERTLLEQYTSFFQLLSEVKKQVV